MRICKLLFGPVENLLPAGVWQVDAAAQSSGAVQQGGGDFLQHWGEACLYVLLVYVRIYAPRSRSGSTTRSRSGALRPHVRNPLTKYKSPNPVQVF